MVIGRLIRRCLILVVPLTLLLVCMTSTLALSERTLVLTALAMIRDQHHAQEEVSVRDADPM